MSQLGMDAIKSLNSLSIFKDFRNHILNEYDKAESTDAREALVNVLKVIDKLQDKYTYIQSKL